MTESVAFYRDEDGVPEELNGRRPVSLDSMTEDDYESLRQLIAPIFQMSYNNMEEDEIRSITESLARVAFQAIREGADILDSIHTIVLPLEATQPYDSIAGAQGHIVDKEANIAAIQEFLFSED